MQGQLPNVALLSKLRMACYYKISCITRPFKRACHFTIIADRAHGSVTEALKISTIFGASLFLSP